jgi:hypothetical protein
VKREKENAIMEGRETPCREVTEWLTLIIVESYLGAAALLIYIPSLASTFARSHSRIKEGKQFHKRRTKEKEVYKKSYKRQSKYHRLGENMVKTDEKQDLRAPIPQAWQQPHALILSNKSSQGSAIGK